MPASKSRQKKDTRSSALSAPTQRAAGLLSIVATPIGNLEDITLRAVRRLKEMDLIVAEDTRRTRKLLAYYDIHCPLTSYYKEIEKRKTKHLLCLLSRGKRIALVTDAGTPGVSDPGAHIISEAKSRGIPVEILPGPSAVLMALVGSGLNTEKFSFHGFFESKPGPRQRALVALKDRPETMVFFIAPHRLLEVLQDMLAIWGDRRAVLCREMTKIYEDFKSSRLSALIKYAQSIPRGELTLVVEGNDQQVHVQEESIQAHVDRLQKEEGLTLNQAIARVARHKGISRAEVYALAHALAKKSN